LLLTADRGNKASIYHCQLSPPLPILRGEQVGAHQIAVLEQPGVPAHVYFHDGDEYSEVAKHYVCAQLRQTYEEDFFAWEQEQRKQLSGEALYSGGGAPSAAARQAAAAVPVTAKAGQTSCASCVVQ
jgi:hypothetical protein